MTINPNKVQKSPPQCCVQSYNKPSDAALFDDQMVLNRELNEPQVPEVLHKETDPRPRRLPSRPFRVGKLMDNPECCADRVG
jgi:hypothetical protein